MKSFVSSLRGNKLFGGFSFFIARRYLFSKKSHNAINIISAIAVCGVALATMALVCTLSVFNGFQDLVASMFTHFDPQLKIVPAIGKSAPSDDPLLDAVRNDADVQLFSECLEDNALILHQGHQQMVTLKGVDDNFKQVTNFEEALYGNGSFEVQADVLDFGILGIQIAREMGLGTEFPGTLEVYAPKKGERVNMGNPAASFNKEELYSPGVVFGVQQAKYDANYIVTSLDLTRKLFDQQGRFSSLELRVRAGAHVDRVKSRLNKLLEGKYIVKDRYEQQEDVFRIMKIEKLIAYIILTFILMIACFNIVGSLPH